jgi:hypothetical protein
MEDKFFADQNFFITLVAVYALNYTPFLHTTLILPPLFLLSYFFLLRW